MTVRDQLEERERANLSGLAMCSADTRGRLQALEPCPLRTNFQRDRDRILHSKAFRRLKHKTQMLFAPDGDHYRTRLTHTLEVSQVARTLARSLALNEDLAEAIALGHDLGHTPFGHAGERVLDRVIPGGFRHTEQSLRVIDRLERDGQGLNLTFEVRDGIAHHSGDMQPQTLEGRCVHLADRIAYINHDIDDGLRAGLIHPGDLPKRSLAVLGNSHGARIDTMIGDIVCTSNRKPDIRMSEAVWEATDLLRDFLFERIYLGPLAQKEERKAARMLEELVAYCIHKPQCMPMEYVRICEVEGVERGVCDFVACMTDRYAMRCYKEWI
ncbi:MAG: deoxyguanosinetriphosphate triphosphohydrolase [Clostridia bacterium]|nr:deoxyguanosinetriphosphate triphosphohydrolase [Clostridia bacterium]